MSATRYVRKTMVFCLGVFLVIGTGLLAFAGRLSRHRAFAAAAVAQATLLTWMGLHVSGVVAGDVYDEHLFTVPAIGFALDFHLDGLSLTLALVDGAVGLAMALYAANYFADDHPGSARLAGLSTLFTASMLGVVLSDNIVLLYLCWAAMTLISYRLIGYRRNPEARAAARRAILITGPGGVALLIGLVILARQAHSTSLNDIVHHAGFSTPIVALALVGVLLGAFTKSAQYPFHSWLPAALDAPTPISAFLHASTMVKCGIYLIARFAMVGSDFAFWLPTVITVGVASMFVGGYRAVRTRDLNLLLAFGTVNQLGLLIVLFGIGSSATDHAAWMLLVAHAGFKAAMFMVVGVVERNTGAFRIGAIPPLGRDWRLLKLAALLAAASMVGVPTLAGAVGKEAAYVALLHASFTGHWLVIVAIVVSASLTVAYGWRFIRGIGVFDPSDQPVGGGDAPDRPLWTFVAPVALLALAGPALGWAAGRVDELATAAVHGLGAAGDTLDLEVFYGLGLPLVFSFTGFALGAVWVVLNRTRTTR